MGRRLPWMVNVKGAGSGAQLAKLDSSEGLDVLSGKWAQ